MTEEPSTALQRRWNKLLSWLSSQGFHAQNLAVDCREKAFAGNGLFSRSTFMPGSLLFVVPPNVLMNQMTLKRCYPPGSRVVKALTAIQFMSMHLFLWRPKANEDSGDPFFGPYISVLPRSFESHPLSWLVLSKLNLADDLRISLLNSLPPSVLTALRRLHIRFRDDWCNVRAFLRNSTVVGHTPSKSLDALDATKDFLWAWLNVNTRCIYYRLKHTKTDPDNVTLCPVVDFANHTSSQACMIPVPSDSEIRNAAPVNLIGDGLKLVCHDNVHIKEDDEILLTYGLHSNKMLFVEYGFINSFSENAPSPSGEVDVQDLVEEHFVTDIRLGEVVKPILVAEGYWGDWTLHSTADGAQPSWRLIAALRLYHLVVAAGSADEDIIQTWRDVIMGKRLQVSGENERCWRKTVVFLCDMVIERAEVSLARIPTPKVEATDSWAPWMLENIRSLWKEEVLVAGGVKERMQRGDEF